ncbi:hypothetical protein CPB84DRAFT_1752403 [Gymnopilus junonius]|uniref:Uncharacterized protein n=1 Tax=Gymnopilus junonius TaxID=109634 RepID=A0A9P5NBM5_GYMJU|nr:hypothetical protein CPB84DRAFT_1752403 [Gymnopilus junonius]
MEFPDPAAARPSTQTVLAWMVFHEAMAALAPLMNGVQTQEQLRELLDELQELQLLNVGKHVDMKLRAKQFMSHLSLIRREDHMWDKSQVHVRVLHEEGVPKKRPAKVQARGSVLHVNLEMLSAAVSMKWITSCTQARRSMRFKIEEDVGWRTTMMENNHDGEQP